MKNLASSVRLALALVVSTVSTSALADSYDINFTSVTPDNTVATGQLTVADGLATGGSLDVVSGPDAGTYTLVPGVGGDNAFTYDNTVTPGGPTITDDTGLLWSLSGAPYSSMEVNLWYNPVDEWGAPAGSYSFWGASGGSWNLEAYGIATLAPSPVGTPSLGTVPDGCLTGALLGAASFGLVMVRRNTKH